MTMRNVLVLAALVLAGLALRAIFLSERAAPPVPSPATVVPTPALGQMNQAPAPYVDPPYVDPPLPVVKPIPLRAPTLIAAYHANEIAADERYKGKRVRVFGLVTEIGRNAFSEAFVKLGGDFRAIMCYFPKGHNQLLATIHKKDAIILDGDVAGMTMGWVALHNCNWPATYRLKAENPEMLKWTIRVTRSDDDD